MGAFPEVTDGFVARYNVAGPRYTSYPTVPEWTREVDARVYAERLAAAAREGAASPLSLYLHLPFCREMCAFCGCNVVITQHRDKADPYLDRLAREMEMAAGLLGERRRFSQLHYGGGTPTFLDEAQLARLWREIRARFEPTDDAEVAVEVDPVVTTRGQLALLREQGFNRVSMGVQDFDDTVQRAVHRIQGFDLTRSLVDDARRLGFRGINLDLIFGLPHQTAATWEKTLERVLAIRPDRLAVYSFAYLPDLRPHMRTIDPAALPDAARKLGLFGLAYDAFVGAGYRPIGMDHFALPDDELARAQERRALWRNFQGYSVKKAADVVAFGITGIGDVQGAFVQNVRPLPRYYRAVDEGRFATERGLVLSVDDRRRRDVITDLMCNFWSDLGKDGGAYFAHELEDLRALEREGLVRVSGREVELPPLGRVFVRNVAMVFDAYLRRPRQKRRFSMTV